MLSAFTDLVGPASFPDTRLGRKWITGSVYKSRTPWMSTIILKANSVIQLATFLPNEEKRRTVSWKQNPSCISPSWKTLLSSAQAPSRLDESEVTSVKHRSVKYFENISSRIESDSKAAESLRSRPWTHGRSAVGIVLSVPRVSCGNRVWLPSSERLGSYDIIMIFLWWFYLLSYCTSLLTIVHRSFTRDTNEVVHFKALSQHKGFSAVGDFLWQLHHLGTTRWNMMKIRQFLRNWNDEMIINSKKSSNWLWRLKAHSAHSSWFWSVVFIWTKIPVSVPKSVSQQEIDIMCSTATQARFNCMTMYFLSNSSTHVQRSTVIHSDLIGYLKILESTTQKVQSAVCWVEFDFSISFISFDFDIWPGWRALRNAWQKFGGSHRSHTLASRNAQSSKWLFFCLEVALWISRPHFPIYEVVNFSC